MERRRDSLCFFTISRHSWPSLVSIWRTFLCGRARAGKELAEACWPTLRGWLSLAVAAAWSGPFLTGMIRPSVSTRAWELSPRTSGLSTAFPASRWKGSRKRSNRDYISSATNSRSRRLATFRKGQSRNQHQKNSALLPRERLAT